MRIFDCRNTGAGKREGSMDEHIRKGLSIAVCAALAWEVQDAVDDGPATMAQYMGHGHGSRDSGADSAKELSGIS